MPLGIEISLAHEGGAEPTSSPGAEMPWHGCAPQQNIWARTVIARRIRICTDCWVLQQAVFETVAAGSRGKDGSPVANFDVDAAETAVM